MPKVRTLQRKPPPDGWDTIHPVLQELEAKMRDAEQAPHQGLRKNESLWPIYRIHHQRSRYVYEMYYKRKAISRELYDYCLREKWADPQLIAKWKRNGFEQLCCMRCIQAESTNFGSVCVCRVPRKDQLGDKLVECANCGCRGCASGDV